MFRSSGKILRYKVRVIVEIPALSLWWRNLGLRWSLLLVRLEEDKQSTIALGYLGDREESDIVAPKKCMAMETL